MILLQNNFSRKKKMQASPKFKTGQCAPYSMMQKLIKHTVQNWRQRPPSTMHYDQNDKQGCWGTLLDAKHWQKSLESRLSTLFFRPV